MTASRDADFPVSGYPHNPVRHVSRRDVEYDFFTPARPGQERISSNGTHHRNRKVVQ
jgi:hypothetical protein